MAIRFFITFLAGILLLPLFAQENQPIFVQFELETIGLNNAGFQNWDSKGRLWMISNNGLTCYDGYSAKTITHKDDDQNSPISNKTRLLQATAPDEFWLTYRDQNGLTKFNPITLEFTHFLPDTIDLTKLPDNETVKIIRQNDSIFWDLTWGGGIAKINLQTKKIKRYFRENAEDWLTDSGVIGIPCNYVKEMIPFGDDLYLIGFFEENRKGEPHLFNPTTGEFSEFDFSSAYKKIDHLMALNISKALTITNFIYADENLNLWFGTYSGIIYYDVANNNIERISTPGNDLSLQNLENARNYVIDKNGVMWVGTSNQGILVINTKTKQARSIKQKPGLTSSLANDQILTLGKDSSRNIWISTGIGTISIYCPFLQHFQTLAWQGMPLEFTDGSRQAIPVNQMLVLANGKVLLSHRTGLIEYDPVNHTSITIFDTRNYSFYQDCLVSIGHFRKVENLLIFPLVTKQFRVTRSVIYDLSSKKLNIYDSAFEPHGLLFRHSKNNDLPIVYFNSHKEDHLYMLNESTQKLDSVLRFEIDENIVENFSIVLNSGHWMLPTNEGSLIIVDPEKMTYVNYNSRDSSHYFPDSTLTTAFLDASGIVWIGTATGLYTFDEKTRKTEKINSQLDLPAEEKICSIIRDKNGDLWIALHKDLIRWNDKTGEQFRFSKKTGLRPGYFLASVAQTDSAGNLYFAASDGIVRFNPDEIIVPTEKPEVYVAMISIMDDTLQENEMTDFISKNEALDYNRNFLRFEFYTNEVLPLTPNKFFYRLTGRDENWQDNGVSNKIRLTDISYGDYVLEVKVVNTFDNESSVLSIPFSVKKPFWLQAWFIILIVLLLAILVWIYIRSREKVLRKKSELLEQIVTERTAEVVAEKKEADKQRLEAEHQKEIVEEKQKEISDSINYAKRIQNAILPSSRFFKEYFPQSFILYLPKDIVAGDFYFMEATEEHIILAVADCTGHGVPGAMVSVVCHNALTRSVKEFGLTMPDKILDKTRELVLETFSKSEDQVNDGMDIAICSIHRKTKKLYFSGANNGMYLFRNKELIEFKGNKQPIGKFIHAKPFTSETIDLTADNRFYLYSDGYADQFGGEEGKPGGKKFKYSRLKALLSDLHLKPENEQHDLLNDTLNKWRGSIEQVDDICIIGFQVD